MRYSIMLAILLLVFSINIVSQQPNWIKNPPVPESPEAGFFYKVAMAEGVTESEARINALSSIYYEAALKLGLPVTLDELKKNLYNSGIPGSSIDLQIPINKVCEYSFPLLKKRGVRIYLLCQVAIAGNRNPAFEQFTDCFPTDLNVGVSSVFRSLIIPGWGQFHKGQSFKGGVFLLGTIGLTAATLYAEMKREDNFNKAQSSNLSYDVKEYSDRAEKWKNFRNITGIVGIALYVYNVFDALSSKPERGYAINVKDNGIQFSFDLNKLFNY